MGNNKNVLLATAITSISKWTQYFLISWLFLQTFSYLCTQRAVLRPNSQAGHQIWSHSCKGRHARVFSCSWSASGASFPSSLRQVFRNSSRAMKTQFLLIFSSKCHQVFNININLESVISRAVHEIDFSGIWCSTGFLCILQEKLGGMGFEKSQISQF